MLFTPDERRALIALGGLLILGLLARLVVSDAPPPEGGGDSLLVILAAGSDRAVDAGRDRPDSTAAPPAGLVEEGRVRINDAGAQDLVRLPRIGPRLAERIIATRARQGPFRSAADLMRVPGIGPKTAALLAPLISCSTAASRAPADCTSGSQGATGLGVAADAAHGKP
ncbi:MAG: helix-hairpin-helix domain-containing protein [Candidatus Eisenbacteria bacterium]|nr:helix-hairpin-helix domain-containing protein [Candidatus Eisenbacteria bacterium]